MIDSNALKSTTIHNVIVEGGTSIKNCWDITKDKVDNLVLISFPVNAGTVIATMRPAAYL